jgi:thioester reductase-like protein
MGDLSKLKCGLSPYDYDVLSKNVDVIIHNGAYVHHLYNYEQLKATNVGSTRELLKLCVTFKLKELHFVSTLSAIPPSTGEKSEIIPEDFVIYKKFSKIPKGGYAQTKYVSEYLIGQAKSRGIPISIYRPSWILGHDKTGISPIKDNHLLQLIKGCTQLKSAPDWKITLDILPVNIVSKCILLAVKTRQTGKVFNIHNRKTTQWLDLIKWMKSKCKIEIIKAEKWHTLHLSKVKEKNTLFPLLAIYKYKSKYKSKSKFQKLPEIKAKINDKNAHIIMQKIIKDYPDCLELFKVYFLYFYNTGFIKDEFNIPHINL